MAAGKKIAILLSFLLCLLGAVMIIGALALDKWQSPVSPSTDPDTRVGLRQSCFRTTCTDVPTNTTDCSFCGNCDICLRGNDMIRSNLATMGLSAVAVIFFLIGAIIEAVALVGKSHSKKHHGIAFLMLLTMLLAFAAVGVYGSRVATVTPTGNSRDLNASDSFNLVAVSGGVAFVVMVMSIVFMRS